ncbi:MAG TPA: flagellar hook-filament junction protein FlgL [Serratia grimesii]|jgi:flagellar hook-associated protein 3 FlgL|uniref:Flagellar hook protein FlgL n=1 Tax=Serratia grimesii TaxID=82995 RepID=A0A9C7QTH3_9GAMM|nr:flagellar hook-associated protein FlgL [Serratia grimesii]KFB89059.1 flagellar hook protein FlgL [Serratia grimesii]CAI0785300.1 Hook-filament junction protein [Serratia grimesii]CAI1611727.1 Hook-filament junction protein [Serratia grimesii]CAI2789325.1 Hook-filament junction protein [Serratia grimesii]HCK00215.1 flagellar hook-filament junction protein FlgL [Serratia grimesii]
MRMSTSMMYQQNMSGITGNQSLFMKAAEQLSTGKRVINPSDDPLAASQAVMLSQSQAENNQYTLARTFARQSVSMEETVLAGATTTIADIKALIVSAGSTESDNDRDSMATQLQGMKDQLLNLANSTDGNGRYMFGGYVNDKPPFVDEGGTVSYKGGDRAVEQKVDANRTMTIGHTGSAVFMSLTSNPKPEPDGSAPVANVFESIDIALKALKTPLKDADDTAKQQVNDALAKANRGMDNSYNKVLSVRAELGSQLQEMDQLDSIGKERDMTNQVQMSALTDADLAESISAYFMQQAALQASYKTFGDMQGMSLFQMNR